MTNNHQSMSNVPARKTARRRAAIAALLLLATGAAFATTSTTSSDELGTGICALVTLLQGKFLFGIAVLSMVGGGGALLFGAELSDGVKKAVTITAIVGMIISFSSLLTTAFSSMTSCS
jgi:type IV secretory pathway VirB2 component (pilin)